MGASDASKKRGAQLSRFSIIIPCFNSSSVIEGAISSVVKQGHEAEILIIDGGSSDDTVVRALATRAITKHVSEPDAGIYDAINKGVALASGDLIGVLGSDDRYVDGAFANISRLANECSADIYAGATLLVDADSQSQLRLDERYGEGALISGIPFGHNAMFATRSAYARVGAYSLSYRICADAHWVHRAIKMGLSCAITPEIVVEFSTGGTSSVQKEDIMEETYQTISENFSAITLDHAKTLLYAARRWGPADPVVDILRSNPNDELLQKAVRSSLPEIATAAFAKSDAEPGLMTLRFFRRIYQLMHVA